MQSGTYSTDNLLLEETIQLLANGPVEFVANSVYPALRVENSPFPATIDGITFRSNGYYNTRYGITVANSRLNLENCKIVGIHGVEGAGLFASGDSDVTLRNCEFRDIASDGSFFAGPIYITGSLSAFDCLFQSNGLSASVFNFGDRGL